MNLRPKIIMCHQIQKWAQLHLEHDQVVVMSLYLEDVGQSHHPCFEIWRINCKTQMRDDLIFRLKQSGQSARTGRGAECFYWPSRLMRGSAALLLAAASGSQFLYLSTEERHETHPHVHWILACRVDIKVILNMFLTLNFLFYSCKRWSGELAPLEKYYSFYNVSLYCSSSAWQRRGRAWIAYITAILFGQRWSALPNSRLIQSKLFTDVMLDNTLSSYHYLHIHIVQPGPVTSPKPPASPDLQMDSWRPASTAHRHRTLKHM